MIVFELAFRAAASVFTKEGVSVIIGGFIASIFMIHSTFYSEFIYDVNNYFIDLYYLILGPSI